MSQLNALQMSAEVIIEGFESGDVNSVSDELLEQERSEMSRALLVGTLTLITRDALKSVRPDLDDSPDDTVFGFTEDAVDDVVSEHCLRLLAMAFNFDALSLSAWSLQVARNIDLYRKVIVLLVKSTNAYRSQAGGDA